MADDIKDGGEIKDIHDELNIMLSVFYTQNEVMKTMEHMMLEQKG